MTLAAPRLRLDPADAARLAAQARTLGAVATREEAAPAGLAVIAFAVGGQRCAVEAAAVVRVVTRLGPTVEVPLAAGGSRPVAWVEEQPVAVTDLVAAAGLPARRAAALSLAPALVVATQDGLAAVAVEGPLELAEAPLAAAAGPALRGLPGLAIDGQLEGGEVLLSAAWLRDQAAGAPSP